jgi:chemotaxis protein CheX
MNDAMLEPAVVNAEDVITITLDVWLSFLDIELEAVAMEAALLSGPAMAAAVQISGAWEGAVRLECAQEHAAVIAARMFSAEAGSVSGEQARDALGELANVVSGNIKSLLPAPSALSMPLCWSASVQERAAESTAALVSRTAFAGPSGALHVSIWKSVAS